MSIKILKIAAFLTGLFSTSLTMAAPITAGTYNIEISGTVTQPIYFTSFAANDTVYTSFEYGTVIYPGSTADEWYYPAGNNPGSEEAALGSQYLNQGVLNVEQNVKVNFGRAITAEDMVFVTELVTSGDGETLAMGLIDENSNIISGTAVNFGSTGDADLFTMTVDRSSGGSLSNVTLRGEAVALSEFGATSTPAWGIYFSNSSANQLDPSVVGLATVPEPSTYALLLAGILMAYTLVKRRRSA